ncbi:MAG TPA: branched-chain amino acid ABC transporter permease [Aromatoleum sp.]|uniref:branched-chain amino acid ABC transporter permease n=1 Tax=Aromatoleum sp. TaxID=2307007 RepID=UPI002B48CE46|nr:branched-chain amino acid ABC transporter permease [Aromatoleum sp.]HJV28039.1 branched-chain amino acid ABC transporter permease [Aromatoleum sp.]
MSGQASPQHAAAVARRLRTLSAGALVAAVAVFVLGADYALSQAAFVATYAIAGLGMIVIVGQCGQISLGQGALLGLGAYVEALLVVRGVPAPLAMAVAVAAGTAGGWLASLPARRLGGLYFAMSTLAFALIVEEALVRAEALTHGAAGLAVPTLVLAGFPVDASWSQALAAALALALAWIAARRCVASRLGRSWHAVREDEAAAAACGVDVARAKRAAFAFGGALSGLAGALYAHWIGFVSPEQFGLMLSFELLMLAFIGGARELAGALWGALVVVALPQAISVLTELLPAGTATPAGLESLLFGAVVVALILLRPGGLTASRTRGEDPDLTDTA